MLPKSKKNHKGSLFKADWRVWKDHCSSPVLRETFRCPVFCIGWLRRTSSLDETAVPSVYFCPLLNLAMSSTFKSAECGSHSSLLVVSVVLLCINNSTSVATSNKLHRAETRLTVPNVGVDFLQLSQPKACFWTLAE